MIVDEMCNDSVSMYVRWYVHREPSCFALQWKDTVSHFHSDTNERYSHKS